MKTLSIPADVVQVELTGQSWFSAALPMVAIVISLISLGITLWLKFRDDARLDLQASQGYVVGRGVDDVLFLHLEATNIGRSGSTVIQNIGLRLADGQGIASISPTKMDSSFPMTLSPGESAHRYFSFKELSEQLRAADPQGQRLRIEALSGHGRVRGDVSKSTLNRLHGR
jgi:hypothetical protein